MANLYNFYDLLYHRYIHQGEDLPDVLVGDIFAVGALDFAEKYNIPCFINVCILHVKPFTAEDDVTSDQPISTSPSQQSSHYI